MKAILLLANGMIFEGEACGAQGTVVAQIAVDRSIVGYQELISDSQYFGKILMMTYPVVGNTGMIDPIEKPEVKGLIVREMCKMPSNWRENGLLSDYLKANGVVAIEGVDTREITNVHRENGSIKALITTDIDKSKDELLKIIGGAL